MSVWRALRLQPAALLLQIFVAWAVTVYVLYVIWVFCGDEWHERGRPQPDIKGGWLALQSTFRMRWAGQGGFWPAAGLHVRAAWPGMGMGTVQMLACIRMFSMHHDTHWQRGGGRPGSHLWVGWQPWV